MQLLRTQHPPYQLHKVGFVVTLVSLSFFLFAYLSTLFMPGKEFNWVSYGEYLKNQVLGTVCSIVFFYLTLNHFHALFAVRSRWTAFLPMALAAYVVVIAYNMIVDVALPLSSNKDLHLPFWTQVFGNSIVAFTMLGASLLIAYINNLRELKRKHRILEEQKLKWEVEKTVADLKFLKSQINPHFLHNTLNSFYARSLPLSKELADGILTLSEIMRYALQDVSKVEVKVPVRDEIEHVRNLIKMHQFRYRNKLAIHFEVEGVVNGAMIPPFILITLVENIFKHGELTDPEHPVQIRITLGEGHLHYFSRNAKKTGPKELSTGIGLENIQKRLQLVYGKHYQLHIKDETNFYTTDLIIDPL